MPPSGNESEDEDESPGEVIKNGTHLNDIKSNGQMSTVGEDAQNIEVHSDKKRRSDPSQWRRSKKKVERRLARRQLHIPTCRCKCKDKISEEIYNKTFKSFQNMNHNEQNIYLRGCISLGNAKRHVNKNKQQRKVFIYNVLVNTKKIDVCQKMFLHLHGIKRDRLKKKILNFEVEDVRDYRGKHTNRQNRIPEETIKNVHSFLKNLPVIESHYSRSQNKYKKYLSSDLTVASLHKGYCTKYPEYPMKYRYFHKIFVNDFNYSFAHPKKDICTTCTKFMADLHSATFGKDENKIRLLKIQKELHLRKAQTFFDKLKERRENSNPDELVICFDFQKNLPLPVTNITDEYYKRQLWLHNFGINNIVSNQASMFLYTENFANKGPNEVITSVDYYIKKYRKSETKLIIFCDNCFSQNKNRYLFTYLDSLCAANTFQSVAVFYPIPGHSMMPIDRCYALVEKKKLKREKIDNPDYYIDLIQSARPKKPFEIIFLQHSLLTKNSQIEGEFPVVKILDYKKLFANGIKPSIPGISKCRSVMFSSQCKPKIRETMSGDYRDFVLHKTGHQRYVAGQKHPPLAYTTFLKIKPDKLQNVKFLALHIQKVENRLFYDILDEDGEENGKERDVESDAEIFE